MVATDDDGMTSVAVDEGADAVGLCATIGGGFAQFAEEHSRAVLDGLPVWVGDGIGVVVFFFCAEVCAFQVVVDDEQAVSVAVYPACSAMVAACGVDDAYGVAQEWMPREDGCTFVLPVMVVG